MLWIGVNADEYQTDAVLMDSRFHIIATAKQTSAGDIMYGIESVLEQILNQSGVDKREITSVMIGTTQCEAALLKKQDLAHVCTIRIGQATGSIPPLFEASRELREAIRLTSLDLSGGYEVDNRPSASLPSRQDLATFLESLDEDEVDAFVITGTFSPLNESQELLVASWIREIMGTRPSFTLSHELGSIGFVERENAAILNAALFKVMRQAVERLTRFFRENEIWPQLYFSQHDGSLMSSEYALRYPIRTLQRGPANSFRGVSFLTGLRDCIVVDVGKKRTHIGVLEQGFPKESCQKQRIAGVFTHLWMPESVSLSRGGDDLINDELLEAIYQGVQRFLPRYEPLPIVFVGEGSADIASRFPFPWSDVLHPPHFEYASAIGACMTSVSGTIDRMYWLCGKTREEVEELAMREAVEEAVRSGAKPDSVRVQSLKTTPLSYIPSQALRIQVKAVGTFPSV